MVYPSEHRNNREKYLELIAQRGLKPRFSSFLDNPNYMKLVNETRQSEAQTSPLQPVYDLDAAEASFAKFVDKGGYYEGWYNDGIDVNAEAEIVARDVLAGKTAKDVKYGRQDVDFEFNTSTLRKSINSQMYDYGGTLADLAKVIMNMQEILDGSVLLEIHKDKAKGNKANSRLLQTYVLLGVYKDENDITPVQFEIKQYINNDNRLYLAVAMTKIETGVMDDTALTNEERTRLLPVSEYSVPQIISKINIKDKNFFKYIPDEFLNDSQKEAKNTALVVMKIGDILKNSIAINETSKSVERQSDMSYVLIGAAHDNNNLYAVRSVVSKLTNNVTSIDIYQLYAVKGKKTDTPHSALKRGAAVTEQGSLISLGYPTISVADFLSAVKDIPTINEVFSKDVAQKLGVTRFQSTLSQNIRYALPEEGEKKKKYHMSAGQLRADVANKIHKQAYSKADARETLRGLTGVELLETKQILLDAIFMRS